MISKPGERFSEFYHRVCGRWLVGGVNDLRAAGKAFIDSAVSRVTRFLEKRVLAAAETVCTKIMYGSLIAFLRLIKICLGTGSQGNKFVASLGFVPLLLFNYLFFQVFNLVFKFHVFLLKRKNQALKREYLALKVRYDALKFDDLCSDMDITGSLKDGGGDLHCGRNGGEDG